MNVSLTKELEKLVDGKVASGRYSSASEVVRDALRLLEDRDRMREVRMAELSAEIRRGVESGDPLPGEEVFARVRARRKGKKKRP